MLAEPTDEERRTVFECLRASVYGPFFPDHEFETLFGLKRSAVGAVLARWPSVDDNDDHVGLAINNALVNLLGYPTDGNDRWEEYISVDRQTVEQVFHKWRGAQYHSPDAPAHLASTFEMIRGAYPDGLPPTDYWPLLGVLRRGGMSFRSIADVMQHLGFEEWPTAYNDAMGIHRETEDELDGRETDVVSRLRSSGYDDWLAERH